MKNAEGKVDLRGIRIMHKPKKKRGNDEPECIEILSDDEDDSSEDKTNGAAPAAAGEAEAANGKTKRRCNFRRKH
jgi:hypothetical protein